MSSSAEELIDPRRFASRWTIQPSQEIRSAARSELSLVRWDGVFDGPQEFPCQVSEHSVIAIHENSIANHTLLVGGREVRRGMIRPMAVQIVPAGADVGGRCGSGAYHFSHLHMPKVLLARTAIDLELYKFELIDPAYGTLDPLLLELSRSFNRALASDEPIERLYAEELCHLITVHVLRTYSAPDRRAVGPKALIGWRLKRVIALIETTMPAPVDLATLAAAAGLSISHFRAAFRGATGATPSMFVMARRIECAKIALARTDRSIAQVAADCGFADQAHFTRRFRAVTGVTPAAYRTDRR